MKLFILRVGCVLLLLLLALSAWLFVAHRNPDLDQPAVPVADVQQQIRQGAYLARIGNCMSCHTARGGAHYAGGRAIPTPFGNIYASNLTPDHETGIGNWSKDDFWRAMHDGRSKDGRLLYPAFPYPNYTHVSRADSDALFAYLQTLPAVSQENRTHELHSPYNNRLLLYAWRALYFRPGTFVTDDKQSFAWNRGAYLTQGLGHCAACHSPRTMWGGVTEKAALSGGLIPSLNWYAPALNSGDASLGQWETEDIVAFLQHGVTDTRSVTGPMAEVVANSLQHMEQDDLASIATYLKSLPATKSVSPSERLRPDEKQAIIASGARLYEHHCASCHQSSGVGVASIYPALAGNGAVTADPAVNPIRLVLHGGFAPSTQGNPRPYGMPPFGQNMTDEEIAAVVTYIRNAWGNQASAVSAHDVNQHRSQEGL
ncbi:MAG: cytochrome c [Oxalicibacterium faecigallinarum]|uniref:c-type cytochrome n=1 Tax=Oxalicibacterium faecigallinarum TaxID=573741 RepID=UPI00280A25BA|nr:cytochrome c [Oxalicibacterium faecigallinarum]MDQ7969990.1 cytochrome c [Oxalicibacterium faecigallinarum]